MTSSLRRPRPLASIAFYCRRLAWCVLAVALLAGVTARAQSPQLGQSQRSLEGTVRLASGGPAAGAIVYLKNLSTLNVTTFITTPDGQFHFGHVGMDADYEIYAEAGGKKTKTRRISAFNTKKRWTIDLTLDK